MIDPRRRRLSAVLVLSTLAAATAAWWPRRREPVAAPPPEPAPPPTPAPAVAERYSQPLRLPSADGLMAECALTQPLSLTARSADFALFDGQPTALWHYAAQVGERRLANPLLTLATGDTLDVELANGLAEDTTLHWHGLAVDEANDGSGLHPVAAGATKRYRFRVSNRAGLYWYHAHPHGRTGAQLQRGLAGPLLVVDDEERALRERLRLPWLVRDLPLLLTDKQVNGDNAIVYPNETPDDWIGNRVLVNFTPEPHRDVVAGLYRLRIANVANARMWRLAFRHRGRSLPFRLIGTDGGLLDRAWPVEDVFLAPAQRIDVLVDFSGVPVGERVLLTSLDYVAMENEDEGGAFMRDPMGDHPGATPMGAPLDVMEFRVTGAAASTAVPVRLSSLAPPPDTKDWPVRALHLRMDGDGTWFINDWNFLRDGHAPAFSVRRGSREVWEIRNAMTSMPHPIHLHGFQFRVVSRTISPMDVRARAVAPGGLNPQDLGWTDTVVVWPGEIVRIALDFAQPYRGTQRYMIHCHNLEHEDMGMMATFAVVD
jgi:bilirubin oxidase